MIEWILGGVRPAHRWLRRVPPLNATVKPTVRNRTDELVEGTMWDTNTLWFDVAIVMGVSALGSILFGHFEGHKPKWRRILKVRQV